jgi:hypothetical protein
LRNRNTTLSETIHISDIPGYIVKIFNAIWFFGDLINFSRLTVFYLNFCTLFVIQQISQIFTKISVNFYKILQIQNYKHFTKSQEIVQKRQKFRKTEKNWFLYDFLRFCEMFVILYL